MNGRNVTATVARQSMNRWENKNIILLLSESHKKVFCAWQVGRFCAPIDRIFAEVTLLSGFDIKFNVKAGKKCDCDKRGEKCDMPAAVMV